MGEQKTVKLAGPVEVDESYFGGLEKNKHASKKLNAGRGPVGKTAVVGIKDRPTRKIVAGVAPSTDAITLQGFVKRNVAPNAKIYTDESRAYEGLNREAVRHSVGEYVKGQAHTNGMESFWAMLKRGLTKEPSTSSVRSTLPDTFANSQAGTITGSRIPLTRWWAWPRGCVAKSFRINYSQQELNAKPCGNRSGCLCLHQAQAS